MVGRRGRVDRTVKVGSKLADVGLGRRAAGEGDSALCLSSRREFGFEGMVFLEPADAEDAESHHVPVLIYTLHDGIVSGWTHKSERVAELHFKKIAFWIEPDFYFLGHIISQCMSEGVRRSSLPVCLREER